MTSVLYCGRRTGGNGDGRTLMVVVRRAKSEANVDVEADAENVGDTVRTRPTGRDDCAVAVAAVVRRQRSGVVAAGAGRR